jgi:long-subunit fatty acid transport protein
MKRVFFAFAIVIFCTVGAVAQTEQGLMLVGGSLGFSTTTQETMYGGQSYGEQKITTFEVTPRFGYFVTDALAVGLGLELTSSTIKYEGSDSKQKESSTAISPFVRYYLPMGLFGQGEVGFGSAKYEGEGEYKAKLFQWGVGVGYAIFLNDNVAIEPLVSYGARTEKDSNNSDNKDEYSGIMLNVGFSIYLGR